MLEIAAIIFLIVTAPFWIPIVWGLLVGMVSFGFMAIFWVIFIVAVLYLIFVS